MWFRRKKPPVMKPPVYHCGRVFRDAHTGWWRYVCRDCDYGCSSSQSGNFVWAWLMKAACEHANPDHWSRNRGY